MSRVILCICEVAYHAGLATKFVRNPTEPEHANNCAGEGQTGQDGTAVVASSDIRAIYAGQHCAKACSSLACVRGGVALTSVDYKTREFEEKR